MNNQDKKQDYFNNLDIAIRHIAEGYPIQDKDALKSIAEDLRAASASILNTVKQCEWDTVLKALDQISDRENNLESRAKKAENWEAWFSKDENKQFRESSAQFSKILRRLVGMELVDNCSCNFKG